METVALFDKAGERVDPGSLQTSRDEWTTVATTLSAVAKPVDLTETQRTYQTAKVVQAADAAGGQIAMFDIPRSWNGIRLRGAGITEDGTYTGLVYLGTLGDGKRDADNSEGDKTFDCELAYQGQYDWVIGTQSAVDSGYEMADAVTVTQTESTWPTLETIQKSSPSNNRVAEVRFDLNGADLMVIVPTVASADSIFKAKGF